MSGCKGHRVVACIGIALAGLISMTAILDESRAPLLLKLSLTTTSLSTLALLLDSLTLFLSYIALLLASLASVELLGAPTHIAIVVPLIPLLPRSITPPRPHIVLSGLNTALATTLLLVDQTLVLASIIVLQAILAILTSKRLHSAALLLALATIPFGLTPAITASILSSILVISAGGLIRRVGCPFKVDSNVVFSGGLVASFGVVTLALWGWSVLTAGLWILGFLLVISGTLVPTKIPST